MVSNKDPGKDIDPSLALSLMSLNSIDTQQNFIFAILAVFQKWEIVNDS